MHNLYAELQYAGQPCAHCVAWEDHVRMVWLRHRALRIAGVR